MWHDASYDLLGFFVPWGLDVGLHELLTGCPTFVFQSKWWEISHRVMCWRGHWNLKSLKEMQERSNNSCLMKQKLKCHFSETFSYSVSVWWMQTIMSGCRCLTWLQEKTYDQFFKYYFLVRVSFVVSSACLAINHNSFHRLYKEFWWIFWHGWPGCSLAPTDPWSWIKNTGTHIFPFQVLYLDPFVRHGFWSFTFARKRPEFIQVTLNCTSWEAYK